jgi:hypothetical protein
VVVEEFDDRGLAGHGLAFRDENRDGRRSGGGNECGAVFVLDRHLPMPRSSARWSSARTRFPLSSISGLRGAARAEC